VGLSRRPASAAPRAPPTAGAGTAALARPASAAASRERRGGGPQPRPASAAIYGRHQLTGSYFRRASPAASPSLKPPGVFIRGNIYVSSEGEQQKDRPLRKDELKAPG